MVFNHAKPYAWWFNGAAISSLPPSKPRPSPPSLLQSLALMKRLVSGDHFDIFDIDMFYFNLWKTQKKWNWLEANLHTFKFSDRNISDIPYLPLCNTLRPKNSRWKCPKMGAKSWRSPTGHAGLIAFRLTENFVSWFPVYCLIALPPHHLTVQTLPHLGSRLCTPELGWNRRRNPRHTPPHSMNACSEQPTRPVHPESRWPPERKPHHLRGLSHVTRWLFSRCCMSKL